MSVLQRSRNLNEIADRTAATLAINWNKDKGRKLSIPATSPASEQVAPSPTFLDRETAKIDTN